MPEFHIGQFVTFKPYEVKYLAQVVGIIKYDIWGKPSILPRYELDSTGSRNDLPVKATTYGNCIMESEYFIDFEDCQCDKRGQIDPFDFSREAH